MKQRKSNSLYFNDLQLQNTQLNFKLKLNFDDEQQKVETYRQLMLNRTKLREYYRQTTNFRQNQQDNNKKILLSSLHKLKPINTTRDDCISRKVKVLFNSPSSTNFKKMRLKLMKQAQKNYQTPRKDSESLEKRQMIHNFFLKHDSKKASKVQSCNVSQMQVGEENGVNLKVVEDKLVKVQERLAREQEQIQIEKEIEIEREKEADQREEGKEDKNEEQEDEQAKYLLKAGRIEKSDAQIRFDKMVEYFHSKKIRELASEFGLKKQLNYSVIAKQIKEALLYLFKLKLHPSELLKQQIFSSKPFQKKRSYEFIQAVKVGDIGLVKELVKMNKYLVYDFDYIYMTALHWACKRGYYKIAYFLVRNGADIDYEDIIGRTPLYFSIENEHISIAQLLLDFNANPWSTGAVNYVELCSKRSKEFAKMLSRARKMQAVSGLSSKRHLDEDASALVPHPKVEESAKLNSVTILCFIIPIKFYCFYLPFKSALARHFAQQNLFDVTIHPEQTRIHHQGHRLSRTPD